VPLGARALAGIDKTDRSAQVKGASGANNSGFGGEVPRVGRVPVLKAT